MPVELTSAGEEVLVHLLKVNASVQDLVQFRIAPDQCPIGWKDKTCLVYEKQTDKRQRVASGAATGLVHETFAIYCIDRNRATSRILAQVVRDAITVNSSDTIAGVRVRQVFVKDGERDESLPGTDGQDNPDRYRTIECVVHYRT